MSKERTVEIQIVDLPNKNGRVYDRSIVDAICRRGKPIFGCIGMPDDVKGGINLTMLSHEVTELRVEGNQMVGKVRTLGTPEGKKLEEMLSDVDFRMAGYGNIAEDGVVTNFTLHSINAVINGA